jgi:8-oxo-dGTP pyrophosphatase MutT (NUDIX family)
MTTDPHARLAEFLAVDDDKVDPPGMKIHDAATMLVIERSSPSPKVLMGRRHNSHKFMPGKFVFPGGRVEEIDQRVTAATPLDGRIEARLMQNVQDPSAERARGYALAAIREVFEETGLVLGVSGGRFQPPLGALERAGDSRGDSAAGEWAKFAATGVAPDLAAMHFIARAVTPPGRPRRFDTRFFAVDATAIAERIDGVVGPDTELVELVWLPIDESLKLDIPGITQAVLEELKIRTAAGFSHDLPVPFYRVEDGKRLRTMIA